MHISVDMPRSVSGFHDSVLISTIVAKRITLCESTGQGISYTSERPLWFAIYFTTMRALYIAHDLFHFMPTRNDPEQGTKQSARAGHLTCLPKTAPHLPFPTMQTAQPAPEYSPVVAASPAGPERPSWPRLPPK